MVENIAHLFLSAIDRERETGRHHWRVIALPQIDLASLLSRYATHLVIVLLVAVALLLMGIEQLPPPNDLSNPTPGFHQERHLWPMTGRGEDWSTLVRGGPLLSLPVLRTTFAEPPTPAVALPTDTALPVLSLASSLPKVEPDVTPWEAVTPLEAVTQPEIITYTVRSGDTVWSIAAHFGLSSNTLIWANPSIKAAPDVLKLGQELRILPVDGAYHTVVPGDVLEGIATFYQISVEDIVNYELNQIPDEDKLSVGLGLVIPGGKTPYVPRVVHHYTGPIPEGAERGTGVFGVPVTGRITQGFWERHKAIDIGSPTGTPVYASDSGYVAKVNFGDAGYGNMILIDHGNGFQTIYAHLSAAMVSQGDSVAKGTLIGCVGSTGNSTGPHLHFEIRERGVLRTPFIFLPQP